MSRPPVFQKGDYEKVDCGDFITGVIEEVQEEPVHQFKFQDKVTEAFGVRFKFDLEGYDFPHYSRWNKLNYGERSNLYKKYLLSLVEGAEPVKDANSKFNGFDIQMLKGMAVKTLWAENNGFQNLETIRPLKSKIVPRFEPQEAVEVDTDADHGIVGTEETEEVEFP